VPRINPLKRVLGGKRALAVFVAVVAVVASFLTFSIGSTSAATANSSTANLPPGPNDDTFYTPPSPLPSGNPGDIIRWRPTTAGPSTVKDLTNAYTVMYLSTNANGQPDAVTGTVIVPKNANLATTPIIAMAPGTQGMAFRCAPSKMITLGAYYEESGLDDFIHANYAIAVTDYEGYMTNPKATYMTGKSTGPAVIDSVRAAMRLSQAGLSSTAKVVFRGYSQGGSAAAWAGQLQPTYAPELNLVGVSAGGIPGDLVSVALKLDGSKFFGFLFIALVGFDNAYNLNLNSFLNAAGQQFVTDVNQNDCTLEIVLDHEGKHVTDYTTSTPLLTTGFVNAYNANKLGATAIKVPMFEYHETNDDAVDYNQGHTLMQTYCKAGVNVTWKTYPNDHITGIHDGNADSLAFIQSVLAGNTPTPNCAGA
jgi:hypothetical protein